MNILLLPVGKRSYMVEYFKHALGGSGKVHAANSELSPGMLSADEYCITPHVTDSAYCELILQYCIRQSITAVVPLSDLSMQQLSNAKEKFLTNNIRIIGADYSTVVLCNDKWLTYQFAEANSIHVPRTFLTIEDVLNSIHSGTISYPVMVKPRFGMGTLGVFEAEDEQELHLYAAVSAKISRKGFLKDSIPDGLGAVVLFQEKISGIEYTLDVINDLAGTYQTTLTKKKLGAINGEANPVIFEDVPEVSKLGEQIGNALKHQAVCNVDCMLSGNQVFVLDINPRFGGCYPYSQLAGADVPGAIVNWLSGGIPNPEQLSVTIGTYCYKDNVAKVCTMP